MVQRHFGKNVIPVKVKCRILWQKCKDLCTLSLWHQCSQYVDIKQSLVCEKKKYFAFHPESRYSATKVLACAPVLFSDVLQILNILSHLQ